MSYDDEGFSLVKSSIFTTGATLSYVLFAVTRVR